MLVTALPVANTDYCCSPKMNHTSILVILERIGMLLSGLGLSVNGQNIYCGDYIYSGHTCVLVLSALVVNEDAPRRSLPLMVGVYLIVTDRNCDGIHFLWSLHCRHYFGLLHNYQDILDVSYNHLSRRIEVKGAPLVVVWRLFLRQEKCFCSVIPTSKQLKVGWSLY
ncbi:ceramide phosphoethanolamine synthase-like [Paramacrobiotus metropolitanus]|uniref:ceramide phosphoethanolamine synthase-like n=1 Tax=Paramacrobiotus metropolitanus TaxID=2943436 RepID=UPI00244623E1|nr:ceramide phosphoethanolamine synthase-like [Paramacrobiotus metropolitanus]